MNNKDTGNKGEEMATDYLVKQGYTILHRNWRFKNWEVDIIANKGKFLHFIEVKTRTSSAYGKPEESISKQKMDNLMNAAEEYQYQNAQWKFIQFDVLAITLRYDQPAEFYMIEDVYL
jgi:putative endonuclease